MAKDYVSLITNEHNQRPKYTAMVSAVSSVFGDVFDLLESLPAEFDLDTAEGAQLDVLGLWVGQSRVIPNVLLVGFFGFDNNPAALPYGEEGDPAIGGRFYGEGEPTAGSTLLADPEYRTVIRGRIVRNNSRGLTSEIVQAIRFMFGAPALIDDRGTMTMDVFIGRPLTLVERAIITGLDILPRPSGVRIQTRGYYNAAGYLGFEGQPGAITFAEEGTPGPLGLLMEEF
jgi:hypothetical protein